MRYSFYLLKILFLFILISLAACKKDEEPTVSEEDQPFADFTVDKSDYTAGDNIHLINTSTNGARFRWTFPDGTTGKSRDADYPTVEALGAHSLTFKLEAYSQNSTKSDYTVKIIKVKSPEGQLVLYTTASVHLGANVDVSVDGVLFAQVTLSTNSAVPFCGQAGYPTINVPVGPHLITVQRNGIFMGSSNMTFVKNGCKILYIS